MKKVNKEMPWKTEVIIDKEMWASGVVFKSVINWK
mgnify:CR=1 FL=1